MVADTALVDPTTPAGPGTRLKHVDNGSDMQARKDASAVELVCAQRQTEGN